MGLNKKEEEILKQIEQELMKDDPGLAKTVEEFIGSQEKLEKKLEELRENGIKAELNQ